MPKKRRLKHGKNGKRSSGDDNATSSPSLGYGNPPAKHRWKPGQSGNPTGRRKRVITYSREFLEIFTGTIRVQEGEMIRRVPRYLAVTRKLVEKGLQGDYRSQVAVVQLSKALGLFPVLDGKVITAQAIKHLTDSELTELDRIIQKLASAEGETPPKPPGAEP